MQILGVFLFLSCWVSLAEYILVCRVLSHPVAGEGLVLLNVVAKCRWARRLRIYFSPIFFCWRMLSKLAIYISNLCYCNHFKATLFPLIRFELSIVLLFVNSIVILFLLQTPVCDMFLLNHAILVVMLIYRGSSRQCVRANVLSGAAVLYIV